MPRTARAGHARPVGTLDICPATRARWADVESLFGARGACAGCWCMWWRLRGAAWTNGRGAGNRTALRQLVEAGRPPPGLLAFAGDEPVGWVALARRGDYPRLAHSRVLAEVDATPVWSITCFFVRADWRRRGVASALLAAAEQFAQQHGATTLEGYPTDTRGRTGVGVFLFTGTARMFRAAGFAEVARRSPTRPIMRKALG